MVMSSLFVRDSPLLGAAHFYQCFIRNAIMTMQLQRMVFKS
jgi:hypothetical protein